jgi:hypothetical protein
VSLLIGLIDTRCTGFYALSGSQGFPLDSSINYWEPSSGRSAGSPARASHNRGLCSLDQTIARRRRFLPHRLARLSPVRPHHRPRRQVRLLVHP